MGIDELELTKLGACLFYQWLSFNCIAATMRNGGHNINEAFFVDESHLPSDLEAVVKYVETFKDIVDVRYHHKEREWNEAAL
jgi:hypothetical protein